MKKNQAFLLVIAASLCVLVGCTTTQVAYEQNFLGISAGGEVNLLLARAVPQLTVIIDDKVVLDARFFGTRRVDIEGVPNGEHSLKLFANSWQLEKSFMYECNFVMKRNGILPIAIEVPQYSIMYWIYVIGIAVVSALPTIVVRY
jgi:hypothetical protein